MKLILHALMHPLMHPPFGFVLFMARAYGGVGQK